MKYVHKKTLILMLSAFAVMAFNGCESKQGEPSDSQLVGTVGEAPIAVAGPDRTVVEGSTITLDGSQSYDPDGTIVSYVWSLGQASLTGVTVTVDDLPVGTATVTLTVTDDDGNEGSDTVVISVVPLASDNLPPTAVIKSLAESYTCSPDLNSSAVISLDGSDSSDPEGESLTYAWSGTILDNDSSIKDLIADKSAAVTTIVIDEICKRCPSEKVESVYSAEISSSSCTILFNLDVTDIGDLSDNAQASTGTIMLPSENIPPVADAGEDQTIGICDTLVMDGSKSSDTDGSIVDYVWTDTDTHALIGTGLNPTIAIDGRTPGEHNITLTITDNNGAVASDIVTITVNGADSDYDYSYIIHNPNEQPESEYLTVSSNNAHVYTEGNPETPDWSYWATTTTSSTSIDEPLGDADPGFVNFDFTFPGNIELAYLSTSVTTFRFSYSVGTAYLFASNGSDEIKLAEAARPAENYDYIIGRYNGFLDASLTGSKTLSVSAELHADGDSYQLTAQFLRWRPEPDYASFKLNVCYDSSHE